MAVSLVVTGMQDYRDIDPEDAAPLATAFDAVGVDWMGDVIAVGACIGLIVVVMILMLGQTRVGVRDGPRRAAAARPGEGAPAVRHAVRHHDHHRRRRRGDRRASWTSTTLADLVNIGTLFAFILVSIGVVVLRRTRPDLPRVLPDPGGHRWWRPWPCCCAST